MKNKKFFYLIPVGLVLVFIGLPKVIAILLNSHTDLGLAGIVGLVSIAFGYTANKIYTLFKKENSNEA